MWMVLLVLSGCTKDDTGETADTGVEWPTLGEALDCGTVGPAGGIGGGTDLQRYDIALDAFPDALCNDGTGAFFYFRPHEGALNENDWVIQLQGGGSCGSPESCFERWCSVETNFGMQGMTATESPGVGIRGRGILARRGDNPLGDYNQVFVRYCSSDAWSGDAEVVATAPHPVSGEEVTANLYFRGYAIVDAVLATLRQDGVDAPTYTLGAGSVALPDLDDAETVVLSGGSAGGAGTIGNADRVGEELRAHNPGLQAYGALIDSIFPPSYEHYDYTHTALCTEYELCDYASHMEASHDEPLGPAHFQNSQDEASCVTFHTPTDDVWRCEDHHHVVEHHVTTPLLLRQGQTDELLSSNAIDAGFWVGGAPLDLVHFALLVQQDLAALADPAGNEEADDYEMPPAVFGPTCRDHEVLSQDDQVFDVTIDLDGTDTTMFGLLADWRGGLDPAVAIASDQADNVCP